MSMLSNLLRLARTPQGRRLAEQAVRAARDPKTRKQIDDVRRRVMANRGTGRPR